MTNEDFERVYYPKYKNTIHAIARKLAKTDADLWDDLVSVCMMGLLALDPAKARSNPDAFIRNCLRNKAVDHLRWLRRRDFDRLDNYLMNNHDVVMDPATNEPVLVHGDNALTPVTFSTDPADPGTDVYVNRRQRLAACRQYGDFAFDANDE